MNWQKNRTIIVYIYLPLHYTPESTSSPKGGIYADQELYIDILSASVPDDVMIYVKEHPDQVGFGRTPIMYERINKFRNVALIKEDVDTYRLMKNALAVASLTGSSGIECQYLNIPFLMFGDYFSKFAPGTYHVRTKEECQDAIRQIIAGTRKWTIKDIKIYLKFVERVSLDIGQATDEEIADEMIRTMV